MDDGPKSALELAMARLKQQDADAGISEAPLNDAQKAEIAEVRKVYGARLAQEEILYKSNLFGAGDFEQRQKLDENYRREVDHLNRERDRKIDKIRNP
jgi:hypothetical protein